VRSKKTGKRKVLLFAVLIAGFLSVGCVSAATTHYVNHGESIQAAVDAADSGDIVTVRDGTYTENVDVNKRLAIRSENGSEKAIIHAAGHIFYVTSDYVTISGFTVNGTTEWGDVGIYLGRVKHCTISDNNVTNDYYGIRLSSSSDNIITNNTVSDNNNGIYLSSSNDNMIMNNIANSNKYGIELWDSNNNNTITDNKASNNSYSGILLRMSSNNTLINNTMSGNKYNFGICCVDLSDYVHDIGPSNKVNGKPIYYLVNQQNQQIPDDAGFVGLISSTNITVSDLILTNNRDGVLLFHSNDSRIENVTVLHNNFDIRMYYSNNNTLTNNTANSNDSHGIYLSSSNDNTLANNNASIHLSYYSNCNIINSNIARISLWSSSNNTLINNEHDLIHLRSDSNCNIINNNRANSNGGSISVDGSNNTLKNNIEYSMRICGSNNTLRNNTISRSNKYNFHAEGIQDIDTSNKINGKPIRYLVHEKDLIIDSSWDVGYLGIVNSRNITVRDLILANKSEGILLDHSSDSKIENVTIFNCEWGIYLKSSSNNTVTNNKASNDSTGIYLQNASDNFISNNNASNNSIGIYLWDYSNNNTLTYNTVNFNSFYGIGFSNALSNNIYLNNFNNSKNVRPSGQTNTSWNSTSKITYTYSSEQYTNYMGNYWSNYNGYDSDNDGIGDTPFNIDSHQDYRPLMLPWENYFAASIFDTGSGSYPSIKGTHTGTIKPSHNITVSKLYTYPCAGTGGHTETIGLYENGELVANGTWTGYQTGIT
jgi:parallel beta-helix repeat protein